MSALLPPTNPEAARGYVCAMLGLIPVAGLLLGPAAVAFGWAGWRRFRRDPSARGGGHAAVSMAMGVLEAVVNLTGLALIARGLGWV
ncbi:MAG TPA: hypothetical protein VIL46_15685 [Gemmataceae bacterium]